MHNEKFNFVPRHEITKLFVKTQNCMACQLTKQMQPLPAFFVIALTLLGFKINKTALNYLPLWSHSIFYSHLEIHKIKFELQVVLWM